MSTKRSRLLLACITVTFVAFPCLSNSAYGALNVPPGLVNVAATAAGGRSACAGVTGLFHPLDTVRAHYPAKSTAGQTSLKPHEAKPDKVNAAFFQLPLSFKVSQSQADPQAKVKYEEVYPGIDLVFYGNQRQFEYDFIVAPGADPKAIALSFEGADKVEVDSNGDLVLHTDGGQVRQHKPIVYQIIHGRRREVNGD